MHRSPLFMRACATLTIAAAIASVVPRATAQTDKAGAEVLLEQGLTLKKNGKYAEACPKIEESLKLYPSINTQYHLADCHELEGKMASAWIDFLEVADKAKIAGETAKETKARQRAAAIAPKVSHLTIVVSSEVPGLEVKRSGTLIGKGTWKTALPIDAGEYEVTATAPGYVGYSAKFTVKPDGSDDKLVIPALVLAKTTSATTTSSSTTDSAKSTDDRTTGNGSSRKTIGLVVAGAGVVLIGVGGILGLSAKSKYDGADCDGSSCSQAGVDARDSARSTGNVATILVGVGAAALIGGGVLWLTAPSSSPKTAGLSLGVAKAQSNDVTWRAGITPGGFALGGSF